MNAFASFAKINIRKINTFVWYAEENVHEKQRFFKAC